MTTLEAIKTRRSTRSFYDKPVEVKKLDWIVNAGRYADGRWNGRHRQVKILLCGSGELLGACALSEPHLPYQASTA